MEEVRGRPVRQKAREDEDPTHFQDVPGGCPAWDQVIVRIRRPSPGGQLVQLWGGDRRAEVPEREPDRTCCELEEASAASDSAGPLQRQPPEQQKPDQEDQRQQTQRQPQPPKI